LNFNFKYGEEMKENKCNCNCNCNGTGSTYLLDPNTFSLNVICGCQTRTIGEKEKETNFVSFEETETAINDLDN
jgi:hypothetical protein